MHDRRPLAAFLLVAAFWPIAGVAAVDAPSAGPTPAVRSCAERYPADGPAGLDLQLGCIAAEIVGAYAGGGGGDPARISSWLVPLGAIGLAAIGMLIIARSLGGRLSRRLASVSPEAWWRCPACRSLNVATAARCYACGATPDPDGETIAASRVRHPGANDAGHR